MFGVLMLLAFGGLYVGTQPTRHDFYGRTMRVVSKYMIFVSAGCVVIGAVGVAIDAMAG
jgi:hypothetical protein